MKPTLEDILAAKLREIPQDRFGPFLDRLRSLVEEHASAIIVYGSILSDVTRTDTSIPDFFVVAPSYRAFHKRLSHAVLNWMLPPNIYHFKANGGAAKYNVISENDLKRVTSIGTRDVYHVGRFSKRIGIAWAKNDNVERKIVNAHASAIRAVVRRAYFALPPMFSLEEMIHAALGLSYRGEFRVEATDKVDRLYRAEKEHYDTVFSLALEDLSSPPWNLALQQDGSYSRPTSPIRDLWGRFRLWRFLRRSRFRAKLRWPKGIITVENWVDYLLAKVERTHGIQIQLTERERRYPLIFGWKYFFHLKRKRILK